MKNSKLHSSIEGQMGSDLIMAAFNNDTTAAAKILLMNPKCLNFQEPAEGLTALHIAAALGNFSMVQVLTSERDIDVSLRDNFGRDALDVAIATGHPRVIDELFRVATRELKLDGSSDESQLSAPTGSVLPFRPK